MTVKAAATAEMTPGLPYERIIFRVQPYCVMKQEGQATERGSICQPFPLLSPSHVLLPPPSAHLPSQSLTVRFEFRSRTPGGYVLRFYILVDL